LRRAQHAGAGQSEGLAVGFRRPATLDRHAAKRRLAMTYVNVRRPHTKVKQAQALGALVSMRSAMA
jgi:hypothetical protein